MRMRAPHHWRITGALAGCVVAMLAISPAVKAADKPLQPGVKAPDFTLPDQQGKTHHLAHYRGRPVVLAFYPKDFTFG